MPMNEIEVILKDALQKMQAESEKSDLDTLNESILYQYGYLEKLMKVCKDEKNPKGYSQLIINGKDKQYNAMMTDALRQVERVMRLAEKATEQCAIASGELPRPTKPYDPYYYGPLANIQAFRKEHDDVTT